VQAYAVVDVGITGSYFVATSTNVDLYMLRPVLLSQETRDVLDPDMDWISRYPLNLRLYERGLDL
jgi:hypothetical protein